MTFRSPISYRHHTICAVAVPPGLKPERKLALLIAESLTVNASEKTAITDRVQAILEDSLPLAENGIKYTVESEEAPEEGLHIADSFRDALEYVNGKEAP